MLPAGSQCVGSLRPQRRRGYVQPPARACAHPIACGVLIRYAAALVQRRPGHALSEVYNAATLPRWVRRTGDVEQPPAGPLDGTWHEADVHARHEAQVGECVHRKRSIVVVSRHACDCILAVERNVMRRGYVGLQIDPARLRKPSDLRHTAATGIPLHPAGPASTLLPYSAAR